MNQQTNSKNKFDPMPEVLCRVQGYLRALRLPEILVSRYAKEIIQRLSPLPENPDPADLLNRAINDVVALTQRENLSAQAQIDALALSNPMPPLNRVSMAFRRTITPARTGASPWKRSRLLRRTALFSLTGLSSGVAGYLLFTILLPQGISRIELVIFTVSTILFSWIALNFWTGTLGFISLMRGGDKIGPRFPIKDGAATLPQDVRAALVMPIHNENVSRIFASLQAIYESLTKAGQLKPFDFFILSDTTDPSKQVEEKVNWMEFCHQVDGFGRIFYRRRRNRIHKKSGNIADFCRRWGRSYKYIITLDADSLLSGTAVLQMVQAMEQRPDIGILQTAPKGMNQKTLFSRINQFASHVYSPLAMAGMQFCQLDDASYWGHNAIIRLEPFIKFCALPGLKGHTPFGGEILSHDFVESALMRRSGYGVWLTDQLADSYEELPPNLLTEFERDIRWCRGNLQHLRILKLPGFSFGHRILFILGNMFYFSSFFWFSSLLLITAYAVIDAFHTPVYFTDQPSLFPYWPEQKWNLSIWLLGMTTVFLFLPKILSILWLIISRQELRLFGGFLRLMFSVLLETLFSVFLAPIRMLSHTWFIILTLRGKKIEWKHQNRYEKKIGVFTSLKAHWPGLLIGLALAVMTYAVNPSLFLWLLTIVIPLVVAAPLSLFLSYEESGSLFRKWGLFLVPTETEPPGELKRLNQLADSATRSSAITNPERDDFLSAIADPLIHTLCVKLLRPKTPTPVRQRERERIKKQILGSRHPEKITAKDADMILNDPLLLEDLHNTLWRTPDKKLAKRWFKYWDSDLV
ncbi:MAG TPA: glucans biosynthesis glucosyltransferase MdoH [Candidatus Omnitrophota bacterium]|nr:glucans biosynthesis glucosyltransferase MdoH [Candidatus Omnitrophota bacterium]HQO58880.1 glucans biosynthesis glucosyltransferase MdoH [Candidatus Omnitrophota bacterium]HQP11949.1 glucans biosynthesis glucosyltransferase MdoH [Candidatus Omnitrophota bacterium]